MSACCQVLSVGVLVGMGDVATREAFEWAFGCTGAIKAIGEVARFVDDLAGFKVRFRILLLNVTLYP